MKKWVLYALILPSICWGDIVFSDISVGMYPDNSRYQMDLNQDGIFEFEFYNSVKNVGGFFSVTALNSGSEGRVFSTTDLYHAIAYDAGVEIGNGLSGGGWNDNAAINGYDVYYDPNGPFQVPYGEFFFTNAYIGISFEISNQVHFGWVQIQNNTPFSGGVIEGFAYETAPGVGIVAGAVPEPSSAILFAIGAVGAWTLRKRKNR